MSAPIELCDYPKCDEPREVTGRPGRPSKFCANPDHTYAKALARIRGLQATAEKAVARRPVPITRAVSDRAETLAAVVRRIEDVVQELPALFADASELIGAIADPASVAAEIAQARRDCEEQVRKAEEARTEAEERADQLERERDEALAVQALAVGAVAEAEEERDQALADHKAVSDETRQALTRMQGLLDAAGTKRAVAERERDAAMQTAQARIEEVGRLRTDLDDERRNAQQRVDEIHAAHAKGMEGARVQTAADMAALRADFEQIRTELRQDLKVAKTETKDAQDQLNSLMRTGELVPVAPAQKPKRFG